MQQSKLGLDFDKVKGAKKSAQNIATAVQNFVEDYTTVTVERTLCRLLGIDGIDANEVPLPNIVVDNLKEAGLLGQGVMFHIGNAIVETGLSPQAIAEQISSQMLNISQLPIYEQADRDAA